MITLEATTKRVGEMTLIRVTVTNTLGTAQLVTVESTVEPTWPPKHRGSVRPEWEKNRWQARLEPEETRAFGFGTPQEISSETTPVVIEDARRATDEESPGDTRAVVSSLESWEPSSEVFSRSL